MNMNMKMRANMNMNVNMTAEPGRDAHTSFEGVGLAREFDAGARLPPLGGGLALITQGLAVEDSGRLERLGPGAFVGVEGFLLGSPGPQLLAQTHLRWHELDTKTLAQLSPDTRATLDARVLRGLRRGQRGGAAPVIAVVPGHTRAPVTELAEAVAAALEELDLGAVVVRPQPLPDPAWRAWLDGLRAEHGCVVLACENPARLAEAGRWPSEWTLIAVDAVRSGSGCARAPCSFDRAGRVALGLVQEAPRGPYPDTARWLRRFPRIDAHHHLCLSRPPSFARLARILTGRATSLVLGAGGARGFAHIGVYRALAEAGVELDFVAGTSIGAVVGGLIAHDWEPARVEHAARKIFVEGSSILDVSTSVTSLLAGERLARGFRRAYGEIQIEDLPLSFACTTTDLVSMQPQIHERGRLWELSKASGSMPGAAAPVRLGEQVLVDGGVLNPLPLELARARHGGQIIAVNLVPSRPSRRFSSYSEGVGLGRWLADRSQLHLGDVIRRSLQARAVHDLRCQSRGDELWITPPLERVGVFDHRRFEELVERGYDYTKALLADTEHHARG